MNNEINLSEKFKEIGKTAIKLDLGTSINNTLPLGSSKLGGNPDLPKDFKWFYYEGTNYEDETKNRPLSFLAQINCEEVKKYDKDNLLPEKGILYFFYELSTMTWGYDPKDKGSARVYYFNGDKSELFPIDFPSDMEEEGKILEVPLNFSEKYDLPCYDEFRELYDYDGDYTKYDEERILNGAEDPEKVGEISKLLGYADLIQGGMLLACEEVTNGVYNGDGGAIDPEKEKEFKNNCGQWQLLFQLDSVLESDVGLMFGDCGRIYFYIKKEDLKKCNFDNCWLQLQCG